MRTTVRTISPLAPEKQQRIAAETLEVYAPLAHRLGVQEIKHEMEEQVAYFTSVGKLVEAERIKMRVEYDLEMLTETGYVNGVENYSMYLGNRNV